jgi:hypothetical protein
MDSLFALLTQLSQRFAQEYNKVFSSSAAEVGTGALIAIALAIIGLMAMRRLKQ